MAVKIRLKRLGKKKQPFYRIVVADSRAPRDGRSIEKLGHYNPVTEPAEFVVNEERLFHWLDEGAQPSDTIFSLLRGRGITLRYELKSRNADEATINKEMQKWELARDERHKKKAATESAKMAKAETEKQEAEEAAATAEKASKTPGKPTEAPESEEVSEVSAEEEKAEEVVEEAVLEDAETAETSEAPAEEEAPTESPEKEDS
ncbi:MAG: 30S ribosomal protein S16 [Candidatus Marinimicrobia bacterium]|nr:30S ribosomal protein S16 [Candidatus Neomarinimicrobiota bacterium]